MSGSGKLSFGFNKSANKCKYRPPSILLNQTQSDEPCVDYLASFENCAPKSLSTSSKIDLVIPLTISRSNIHKQLKKKYADIDANDELTVEAINSFCLESSNNADVTFPSRSGTVIKTSKQDTPVVEDIVDADYNQIPIEKFGLALLKGMGLKEDDIKQRTPEDFAAKVRLKGLGLGADPEVLEKARKPIVTSNEKLIWKVGAHCQIVYGRNEGQYGFVQGIDGDTGRVIVKLSTNRQAIKVMQATVRLVSSEEFQKFGNYLNMKEAAQYKAIETETIKPTQCRVSENGIQNDDEVEKFPSKRRREDKRMSDHQSTWLRKGLIVRYLDRESKYYLQKVKILSVSESTPQQHQCLCETESGRTLKNIRERELRSTVPTRFGDSVIVVRGQHWGEIGNLVDCNVRSLQARIRLQTMEKDVLLHYDDICCFESSF